MSAKIRMHLDKEETMAIEIKPFERMFLNQVVGVVLRKRGPQDDHICFEVISEDDGHWYPCFSGGTSSFWFDAYLEVLSAAKKWCEAKAVPHTNQYQHAPERPCGWRFKSKDELEASE